MLPTQYASFLKRWIAHIIDVIIASTLGFIIVFPLVMITTGGAFIRELIDQGMRMNMLSGIGPFDWFLFGKHFGPFHMFPLPLIIMWIFAYTVIYWFYFAIFESSPRQATPGKMMLGLFVTDQYGRRISFPRALGRTVSKVLSQMFCWIGYLLALFTARKQALHDLLAGTLVLEPAYPAPYANMAPPQANIPSAPAAPDRSGVTVPQPHAVTPPAAPAAPDLSHVVVPEPPAPEAPVEETAGLEPEEEIKLEKPDEQPPGDENNEKEKE